MAQVLLGTTTDGSYYQANIANSSSIATDANGKFIAGSLTSTIINVQTFTADGTYTPTSGMAYCTIEAWGGGGGGGGVAPGGANFAGGAGGGAAGYSRTTASAATIGSSKTVTVGTGGAGGAAGLNDGSAGTATSVGSICVSNPGQGGTAAAAGNNYIGGLGGTAGTGDIAATGMPGGIGIATATTTDFTAMSGYGGSTLVGGGGLAPIITSTGNPGTGYGSGGSGAASGTGSNQAGGDGAPGYVVITEYI